MTINTINSALKTVRIGKEGSLNATPSSWTYLKPQGDPLFPDVAVEKVAQTGQRDAGQIAADCVGVTTGAAALQLFARGNGSGAYGGISAGTAELDPLMEVALGSSVVSDAGSTVVTASGSTITVTTGQGSNFSVGNAVLFSNADGNGEVGFIKSISGDTLTLEHAPSSAVAHASIYASSTWEADQIDPDHGTVQLQVFGGDDEWSKYLKGCSVAGSLTIPSKGQAMLDFSLVADDVDEGTQAAPTFSSATDACAITIANSYSWFDGSLIENIESKVDFGFTPTPIVSQAGSNGVAGHRYEWTGAKITGKCYYDATIYTAMQSADTVDMELQVGNQGGNAVGVRMADVSFSSVKHSTMNGLDIIEYEGHVTGADSFYFSLFAA